jgi:hypothetical protein
MQKPEPALVTAEPAAEQPAPAPPKFADGGKPRAQTVKLNYPVEYDGKIYNEITVRRLTATEVDQFCTALVARVPTDTSAMPRLPMFDVPFAVLDALDADDDDAVQEVITSFLPRRLRQAVEQSQQSGGPTPPLSPQLSGGPAKT